MNSVKFLINVPQILRNKGGYFVFVVSHDQDIKITNFMKFFSQILFKTFSFSLLLLRFKKYTVIPFVIFPPPKKKRTFYHFSVGGT